MNILSSDELTLTKIENFLKWPTFVKKLGLELGPTFSGKQVVYFSYFC